MGKQDFLVSICCITYNHENYIKKALDSFLMQQTNFSFEIVIHDDASTDSTSKIIREYEQQHPEIFNVLIQSENQRSKFGGGMNPRFNYPRAKGKYIALCEGDDYWTDPNKLQKQVDFLEKNEDYSICFHNVLISNGKDLKEDSFNKITPQTTLFKDLLNGNYIHTPSVVFKNNFNEKNLSEYFQLSPLGDLILHLFNAQFGKIYKLEDTMAVYRLGSGLWSKKSNDYRVKNTIKTLILSSRFIRTSQDLEELSNSIQNLSNKLDSRKIAYSMNLKDLTKVTLRRIIKKIIE